MSSRPERGLMPTAPERAGGQTNPSGPRQSTAGADKSGMTQRQSERVEVLGALTAGLAHEFNNLFTVVLSSLEQLRRQPLDHRGRQQLERAEWGIRQAGRLARQVLSFVRREAAEVDMVDVNVTILEFDKMLGHVSGINIKLVMDLAPNLPPVCLDPGQLELALLNLVRNAADAISGSGQITIRTAVAGSGNELVEVSVSDTGAGMSPAIAQRSTASFFTTKPRGTGLGLWMVRRFVTACAGQIKIESSAEHGTTVRLLLPVSREVESAGHNSATAEHG